MSGANVCWDVESKSLTNVLIYYQLVTRGQQVLDTMTANVIVEHRRWVNKQRVKSSEMMVSSSLLIVVLPRSKITWVWKRIDYGYESRESIFRLSGRSGEPRVTESLRSTYSVVCTFGCSCLPLNFFLFHEFTSSGLLMTHEHRNGI